MFSTAKGNEQRSFLFTCWPAETLEQNPNIQKILLKASFNFLLLISVLQTVYCIFQAAEGLAKLRNIVAKILPRTQIIAFQFNRAKNLCLT